MAIFKILLSLFSILFIGVYFLFLKRSKNYSRTILFKRCGAVCSKCSSALITEQDELMDVSPVLIPLDKDDNLTECLSCRRESRLNLLISFGSIKDKFNRWILTKKSERILILLIFIPFPFIVASIFIGDKTFSNITSITNSCGLIIYWSLMIYRVYLCRKPIPDSLNKYRLFRGRFIY